MNTEPRVPPGGTTASVNGVNNIDLSEFDPFHVVVADQRAVSPHIFAPPPLRSTASAQQQSNGQPGNLAPPIPLLPRPVSSDPLDSFASLLVSNDDPSTTNASPSKRIAATAPASTLNPGSNNLTEQVQLQHAQRHDAVLSDLAREPFQTATNPSSGHAIHPTRRNSSSQSRAPPPRRLSGLMSPNSTMFSDANHHVADPTLPAGSRSILGSANVFGDDDDGLGGSAPFHASSPPGRAATTMRRMSMERAPGIQSHSQRQTSPSTSATRMPSSPDWGEFFSAPPPPVSATTSTSPSSPTRGVKTDRPIAVAPLVDHPPARSQSDGSGVGAGTGTKRDGGGGLLSRTRRQHQQQSNAPARSYTTPTAALTAGRTNSPDLPEKHGIKLVGVRPGVQRVLEEDVAEGIRTSLPPRLRIATRWSLIYSLDQHGISLGTLYERMRVAIPKGESAGVVVAVKDERGNVFGAFVNERLHVSDIYYGDGTCFVWKALPFPPDDPRLIPAIRTYRWTGRTDYLTLTQQTFLAFGGGYDGRFGLWLDERMEKGYSTRCEAFANEPLVDEKAWTKRGGAAADATKPAPSRGGDQDVDEANFEVFGLECWAVGV